MIDFLKKTAVGGAIMTLVILLAWKFSFILLGLTSFLVFVGFAHCIGDMFFPDEYDDPYDGGPF